MSYAALVRAMSAAGAPPEAIALALEAIEQRDVANEERRAKARDKKRRQRAGDMGGTVPGRSRDEAGTVPAEPAPSPSPLPSPHTPQLTPHPLPHPEEKPARTRGGAWPCPQGVNPDHWRDLQANRRAKRMALTPSALEHQLRQIAKLSDDEWPPGRLVEHAAAAGWAAIHDPRASENRNGQRPHHDRSEPQNPMVRAVQRSEARAARRDGAGVQPHLLT